MSTIYLRASSKAILDVALAACGWLTEGGYTMAGHGYALDIVGQIIQPTGETTLVDGVEVPAMAPIPGWHANVRLNGTILPEALVPFVIPTPNNPRRVWA